jgi:ABC-type multidrug transport system ATPase subunit
MNAISGFLTSSSTLTVTGDIHTAYGGLLPSEKVAYIYQDDSFFSQLTVKETLYLAAALRLYHNVSYPVIHEVVQYLALSHVADSYVGDILTRGISGGERKRLAVACELLGTTPSLIVADEPSSGLDSFQAKQIMQLLRKIAIEKHVAVVCSIHQPRSSIWALFDDVMILTPLGRVAFHGPKDRAIEYFETLGFPCPVNTNPAEFLIDLVSVDHTTPAAAKESLDRLKYLCDKYTERFTGTTHNAALVKKNFGITKANTAHLAVFKTPFRSLFRSTYRFALLLQRAMRQIYRDNITNVSRLVVSSALALVISSIYGTKDTGGNITPDSVANRIGVIANAAINVGMLSTVKALQTFKVEKAIVNRERSLKRYSAYEYLLSKMFAELPIDAAIGAVSDL